MIKSRTCVIMSAVHTVLLDFSIESCRIVDEAGREKVLAGIVDVLQTSMKGLTREQGQFLAPNVFVAVFLDIMVTVRFENSQGLVTVNLEYLHRAEDGQPRFSYEVFESPGRSGKNWRGTGEIQVDGGELSPGRSLFIYHHNITHIVSHSLPYRHCAALSWQCGG